MTDHGGAVGVWSQGGAQRLEVELRYPQTKVELMTGNPKADRSSRAEGGADGLKGGREEE
jgi:hypothetical protein